MVNDRDDFIEELLGIEPQEAALIYEYVYAITDDRATPYGLKSAEEVADYILKTRE
jgi:glutamate racemase